MKIKALLITGQTYTSRRDIKALGGKWNPENEGWVVPVERQAEAEALCNEKIFALDVVEVDPITLETPTGERLRAIRQDKIDRRAARKLARAERLEAQAAGIQKSMEPYNDWAFWTEPIKIGHHSEHRHRRLRDKLSAKMDKQMHLLNEADELRMGAQPMKARIAGDAERKRQDQREKNDAVISVGSRVCDFCFGEGEVVKVFKKSYRIRWDRSGNTFSREKHFVRPV